MIVPIVLGMMCRNTMRAPLPPITLTASTYSRVRRLSVSPRINLAGTSQATSATMKISIGTLGTNMEARTRSRKSVGIASSESTMRIISPSSQPPTNPAIAPHSTPNVVASTAAVTPISSEVWPPTMSRPSTS